MTPTDPLLLALAELEPASARDLARRLDLPPSTVAEMLRRHPRVRRCGGGVGMVYTLRKGRVTV